MSVQGSAPIRTGKFTCAYGEVHFISSFSEALFRINVRGSSRLRVQTRPGDCTGKFTGHSESWRTGKFTSGKIGEMGCTGKFTLAEASNASFRRVV